MSAQHLVQLVEVIHQNQGLNNAEEITWIWDLPGQDFHCNVPWERTVECQGRSNVLFLP